MQARLLARETGDLPPHGFALAHSTELLRTFAPAPQHRFNGELAPGQQPSVVEGRPHNIRAHGAGVSSLAIDKFDGRLLVSGGAEGNIKLWDLESCGNPHQVHTFRPVSTIARSTSETLASSSSSSGGGGGNGHSHGITHLAFYPFDADAFLSSSYDKTLRLWSTARSTLSARFDLSAMIYSHATSPIADHLLVACATQHSHVRLVDLRSGSAVQALVAHGGPVLAVAWSPRHDHILASGHADGKVRVWDVRRAGGVLSLLDQEDSLGVVHRHRHAVAAGIGMEQGRDGSVPRFRASARAHDEAVNGLQWTSDGSSLISSGLDDRVRVWDAATGANTLTSFGPLIQNRHARTASMVVTPASLSEREVLVWANDQEILLFHLRDGTLIMRLRSPGHANPVGPRSSELGRNRISGIAWRSAGGGRASTGPVMGGGNSIGAIYSAHLDGNIRAWSPQVPGEDEDDEDEEIGEDEEVRKRKRKAVDSAYRSLMGTQITFT